ncbi:MAG: hypothetical protein BGO51_11095 [Rhodospirillales bacterium 69-11]|nr:hypothetical protein [Rhodospirillales bacterium]MBN8906126.1 hypothetical protein [Rhodospirillales bacterium]MBN8930016.1 hypothetical protein [Rhodospirillales bacterium]OJW29582.1 MAG: hypothetical protein BGO51_11095 [Rhodospirillales bacterium 69-11]
MIARLYKLAGVALAVALVSGTASAEGTKQVKICPTRDKAAQIVQSHGNLMPDGCRTVTVTRVDSPAGPICQVNMQQDTKGVLNALRDAVTTDQWWTACDNLSAP